MKRLLSALVAIAMLSLTYGLTFASTNNEMLAGSVTIGMASFSAIVHSVNYFKTLAMITVVIPDFTEKSHDDIKAMNKAEFSDYLAEKKRHDNAVMKSELQTEIAEVMKESGDSEKLKSLESKMNALIEENDHALLQVKEMTEKMSTEKAVGLKSMIIDRIDAIKEVASLKKGTVKMEIEMKASQSPGDIGDREQLGQWLNGIGQIPSRRTYIKDRIRTVNTSKEYIKYMDQDTIVRDAKNVAACASSTHNTKLTWAQQDLQMKKVRDFVDVCIDMLDDYEFVEGEIRNLIDSSVALKVDSDLLLADGIGSNPASIASYSSTFNPANVAANYALQVQAATIIDLIVVAGAQIAAFGEENAFMADTVYMNPKDYTLMKLLKDGEDNYIKQGSVDPRIFQDQAGRLWIDGVIMVLPNPSVTQNELYIFDSMKATIYQRRKAVIEFSYENKKNFEEEVVTVKAYERLNMLVRNTQANAFMHVADIAGGVTAITKP